MKRLTLAPVRSRVLFVMPFIMLVSALVLNIVSISIPRWIYYQVDSTAAGTPSSLDYYNRHRGVFVTCLVDATTPMLSNYSEVKYGSCVEMDFGNLGADRAGYLGPGATMIWTLRRIHLALHILAAVLLLAGLIISSRISYVFFPNKRASLGMFATAACAIFAAGFQFGAQVTFMNLMLRETLPAGYGTTAAYPTSIFNAWPSALQKATQTNFNSSYYIALASFGLSLSSGTMNMSGAASLIYKIHQTGPTNPVDPSGKRDGDTGPSAA